MYPGKYKIALNDFIKITKINLDKTKSLNPPKFKSIVIECDEITKDFYDAFVSQLKLQSKQSMLYYFQILSKHDSKEIQKKIKEYKEVNKKANANYLALPKVNGDRKGNILYVGKTNGDSLTRLKNHFGLGSKTTYALHLSKWNNLIGIESNLKLKFHYAKMTLDTNQIDLLELVESALHYKLNPILGRSGH